jgi:3-oxoacyl-[acyl-carrier protein] reductase
MKPLRGRHALVCGASKGIGRATAIALANMGAEVTALARSAEALKELVAEIEAADEVANICVADLDDQVSLAASIDAVVADNPIHIVINNTGGPASGPLTGADAAALTHAFQRHVLSAHAIMQRTLPGMKAEGYGRFINVLSTSVREPIPNLGVSNIIRGAMASWAKSLSRELPPGITINNVLPGFTDTGRLGDLKEAISARTGKSPEEVREGWIAMTPEGRLGHPSELAAAITFLASPHASFIRGVSLPVDGGRLKSI